MRQQSVVLQVLGTLTLWLGWFAFNGGSVLSASRAGIAAHCCFLCGNQPVRRVH